MSEQVNSETGNAPAARRPHTYSAEAISSAEATLACLPPKLRTEQMREVLLRTVYDGRFRQEFRADPRGELSRLGVDTTLPPHLKIDVHENADDTVHIVLPGFDLQRAPNKGEASQRIPLGLYERRAAGEQIDITDSDLESGPVVGYLYDDVWDTTTPPTDRDRKGDAYSGNSDGSDRTWNDNDPKSGTREDTGKD